MAKGQIIQIRGSRLDSLIKQARRLARRDSSELSGLIVDNGCFLDLVECRNKSRRPASFAFYFREVRTKAKAAKALGYEVVGTFHSHPYWIAEPGPSDIENAIDDSLMLVIDCTNGKAKLWRIKNGKTKEVKFKRLKEPKHKSDNHETYG